MSKTTFIAKREELKIVIERIFDAPRELVWKVFTDPKRIPEWWGPRYLTTTVETMDFRVGGIWRFIQRDPRGNVHAFNGVYREIDPPRLISNTFNYEPIGSGHELTETAVFEELGDGRTKVTSTSVFKTVEDLDGMVGAGAEAGAVESYERVAGLLEDIKNKLDQESKNKPI